MLPATTGSSTERSAPPTNTRVFVRSARASRAAPPTVSAAGAAIFSRSRLFKPHLPVCKPHGRFLDIVVPRFENGSRKPRFRWITRLRLSRSWPRIFSPKFEIVGRAVQRGRRDREDLVAGRGHADRVLEFRRQRAVLADSGPA